MSGRLERNRAGFSPIFVTAAISAIALLAALGWQAAETLQAKNSPATAVVSSFGKNRVGNSISGTPQTAYPPLDANNAWLFNSSAPADPNDLSQMGSQVFGQLISSYVALKQSGDYTQAQGEKIAKNIAETLQADVPYAPYQEKDIKTDPDASYKRMLAYRSDMRDALAPLLDNREAELEVFGRYIETKDKNSLAQLTQFTGKYREAAENAIKIIVPKDASSHHLRIINSLLRFAATLEQMVKYADDPMATLALLRTYNSAEEDVLTSFNALAMWEKQKTP